jgi:hypothetical protein
MPRLSKIGAAALAAFGWTSGSLVTASYLSVAGGGGTVNDSGGGAGGGAGGLLTGSVSLNPTLSYTVIVGAGGSGGAIGAGTKGSNSQFGTLTASVGGGGAPDQTTNPTGVGNSGGSGSGGINSNGGTAGAAGGAGTSGQGNNGGASWSGATANDPNNSAGGGGGAGGVGSAGTSGQGGAGGVGLASSITGTSTYYAGGGGGGTRSAGSAGAGGNGGGGTGSNTGAGASGTANTGGGAGGSRATPGGNGGSGVVIISYPSPQKFGGGIVTTSGSNTIHTFQTSGTLAPLSTLSASYLIVAGGAGGGGDAQNGYGAGGGGAGGLLSGSGTTIDTNSTYLVTVGAGGAGYSGAGYGAGTNGTNSLFSIVSTTAVGGGGGGAGSNNALSGGSGGGGQGTSAPAGGAGTTGQGNAGGAGSSGATYRAGGGGGAGAVGASGAVSGNGGAGSASSISGTSTTYAGGGGGGGYNPATGAGTGGSGGGGNGAYGGNAANATANTGGGGGGGGSTSSAGGNGGAGGSGIVIISYAGSVQKMAGGTVTISGGNVIHTFTSSGYLTPLKLVNNSLRFRSGSSTYLSKTTSTSGTTVTYSFWAKRGKLGVNQYVYGWTDSVSKSLNITFDAADTFSANFYVSGSNYITTTQVFRDPAAWYHIVVVLDTTNATASERIRLFVNGTRVTALTSSYPAQNFVGPQATSGSYAIGARGGANDLFYDGYLAEFNLIDGQALTPNSFGTFNSYGVWQPITYGGSYGTNGFYLPFNYNGTTSTYGGSFNGSTQYLTVAPNAAFNMGSGDFTIEAWVYFTASGRQTITTQCDSGGTNTSTSFFFERNASGYLNLSVCSGGTAYPATGTTVIPTNQWVHVAGVRSGNTTYCYLNGILQATASVTGVTINSSAYNLQISGYGTSTANVLSGYISNFRIVKGTAVYTSGFTPPTSPLTAISGTSLLTLQNATVVDNSTNAFTITNTGTVTTYAGYPFYLNIGTDKSPAGNSWTPNNISSGLGNGVNFDVMTDVPTLTSATAANYATLNPVDTNLSATPTLTNGNLTYVANSGLGSRSTIAMSAGKWYCEVTVNAAGNLLGIVPSNVSINSVSYPGSIANSYGYYATNGNKYYYSGGAVNAAYGATYTTGDVIGIAFDADAGTLTYYKNGTSQGTAFTGIASGSYSFSFGNGTSSGSFNFGQQPFAYTPPSGYVALNTYNL